MAEDGLVQVFAPMAPGLKQIAFSYALPIERFPLRVLARDGAVVFEVLLQETAGNVFGDSFTNVGEVTVDARRFRRFLAQDVKPNAEITVELSGTGSVSRGLYVAGMVVVVGAVLLLWLMRAMQRRVTPSAREAPSVAPRLGSVAREPALTRERFAEEIAALDAAFARQAAPSDAVRSAYAQRRQELLNALEAVGAGR